MSIFKGGTYRAVHVGRSVCWSPTITCAAYNSRALYIIDIELGTWYKHKHGISMIYDRRNHSQAPTKKPPHQSYTHYNKARHECFDIVPKNRSIQDKTQRNGITCMQLTSPKVPLSKTIRDQLRLLPISCSRAVIYTFSSKHTLITCDLHLLNINKRLDTVYFR